MDEDQVKMYAEFSLHLHSVIRAELDQTSDLNEAVMNLINLAIEQDELESLSIWLIGMYVTLFCGQGTKEELMNFITERSLEYVQISVQPELRFDL